MSIIRKLFVNDWHVAKSYDNSIILEFHVSVEFGREWSANAKKSFFCVSWTSDVTSFDSNNVFVGTDVERQVLDAFK